MLRQHKLDINLVHDVDPVEFLINIDQFVSEVKKVDYLNLFINSLVPEQRGKELDFMRPLPTEEMLKKQHMNFNTSFQNGFKDSGTKYDKVNHVCDALREALQVAEEEQGEDRKYLLPILTTYIKKQPQELNDCL